ncbi:MAG TPA: peptide ABC transporter substrate-binding protein [Candidatus Cybelea sp.]|jgi:peptide/nickel transport system substrate-binding protein|nr:peptide ABC transporter substrate-binding protein [Candidatus Cybelea sp.]
MKLALRVALLASALAACTHSGARHTSGSTLVFSGLAGEPDSLNPMLSNEADELNFSHLYMSYLIENDDRGNALGEIAAQVPSLENGGISPDERTVTYHLRRNVRWQDGRPLTARDILFSYRAIVDRRNNVATRVGYEEVQRIAAPDPYTVVVRLRRRFAPFVQYFFGPQGDGAIMPEHVLAGVADLNHAAYNERPLGSGPFRVVSWQRGDAVILEANPFYWRGKPRIERLVYRIIADPNTRLQALRTGEADAYFDVDPQLLPQLRALSGVHVALTPVNDLHVLRFNLRDPALSDLGVRRAIAMAIDRKTLIAAATHGSGIAVDADQPSNGWAYDAATAATPYDPVAARKLLHGRSLDLTLAIAPQIINGSQLVAAILQENLRRIGVRVTVKQYPSGMFYATPALGGVLAAGRFQLAYDAWWVLGNDPDDSWNFACAQRPPAGLNYSMWCDARADAAMRDAMNTVVRDRRRADYAVVQRAIASQLAVFTLWQVQIPNAYRSYVHGIAPSPAGSTFWNAWSWTIDS